MKNTKVITLLTKRDAAHARRGGKEKVESERTSQTEGRGGQAILNQNENLKPNGKNGQ